MKRLYLNSFPSALGIVTLSGFRQFDDVKDKLSGTPSGWSLMAGQVELVPPHVIISREDPCAVKCLCISIVLFPVVVSVFVLLTRINSLYILAVHTLQF